MHSAFLTMVENNAIYAGGRGGNLPNAAKMKHKWINLGQLLTQPLRKMAASATQAVYECLMSKNALETNWGGGGGGCWINKTIQC
jgi:hypothetical protein